MWLKLSESLCINSFTVLGRGRKVAIDGIMGIMWTGLVGRVRDEVLTVEGMGVVADGDGE